MASARYGIREGDSGRVETVRVQRYYRKKAPTYAGGEKEEEDDDDRDFFDVEIPGRGAGSSTKSPHSVKNGEKQEEEESDAIQTRFSVGIGQGKKKKTEDDQRLKPTKEEEEEEMEEKIPTVEVVYHARPRRKKKKRVATEAQIVEDDHRVEEEKKEVENEIEEEEEENPNHVSRRSRRKRFEAEVVQEDPFPIPHAGFDDSGSTRRREKIVVGRVDDDEQMGSEDMKRDVELETEWKKGDDDEVDDEESEPDDDDDDDEYDDDGNDDDLLLTKPVFVRKKERETIKERDRIEQAEQKVLEDEKRREQERMEESRRMVLESLRREEEDAQKAFHELDDEIELPDDDDSKDQENEYELWKERELKRIWKEHSQELEKEGLFSPWEEKEEQVVSAGTDESRSSKKSSYRYLQKYYHKGAFFQETLAPGVMKEDIYNRDFNEATGEDRMDRTVLPQVMQVRKYGFASQTKHRHLLEDDTSDKSHPWFQEKKRRDRSRRDSLDDGTKHD